MKTTSTQPLIKTHLNAHVTMEKVGYWYVIRLYVGDHLKDKHRLDDYRDAMDYWKAFNQIARTA